MGFQIRCKTRNGEQEVIMRGNDDGGVDFVREIELTDKDTGKTKINLASYKYFSNIGSALNRLFEMRIANRDASTLQELLANVKEERELMQKEFERAPEATQRRRTR